MTWVDTITCVDVNLNSIGGDVSFTGVDVVEEGVMVVIKAIEVICVMV